MPRLLRQPLVFEEASLDAERNGALDNEQHLLDYLVRRNGGTPPDLVVSISAPAMNFCVRYRDAFFPDRLLIAAGVERRKADGIAFGAKDRVISGTFDFPAIARAIRDLRPETTSLAVVLGASPLEQFWVKEVQRDVAAHTELRVLPVEPLGLEQMRQRVATLPSAAAVLYLMVAVDAAGVQHEDERALAELRKASSVPVFGVFKEQMGRGIVGGSLFDMSRFGCAAAQLAADMLEGGASIGSVELPTEAPITSASPLAIWAVAARGNSHSAHAALQAQTFRHSQPDAATGVEHEAPIGESSAGPGVVPLLTPAMRCATVTDRAPACLHTNITRGHARPVSAARRLARHARATDNAAQPRGRAAYGACRGVDRPSRAANGFRRSRAQRLCARLQCHV